jgi:lactoylglutathione lyase
MIVKDMDESVKFYRDVMGFEIDSEYDLGPAGSITLLKGEGETMVEIIKNPVNEPGLFSIGMDVEDLESTIKELKSKGAKVTMEPTQIIVGTLAFIEDPNGVRIALIQHH